MIYKTNYEYEDEDEYRNENENRMTVYFIVK